MMINTIKKIWKELEYKAWEYLFQQSDNDTNLYFVISGKLLMEKEGAFISYVEKDTLIWEKSFLKNNSKPIDVKVVEDTAVIMVTNESFNNFSDDEKIDFLKEITIYVSDRVNNLTKVMNHVEIISQKIYDFDGNESLESISNIFGNILDLEKVVIFRKQYGSLSKVLWWPVEDELQKEAEKYIDEEFQFYTDNNKLFIVEKDYFIWFIWDKKIENYIVNNIFLNINSVLNVFVEKIEEKKNQKLHDYMNL